MRKFILLTIILLVTVSAGIAEGKKQRTVKIFLAGDSTVANYADNYDEGKDYYKTRYPVTGWGQVFQEFFKSDSLKQVSNLIKTDSVVVDDRARGGRSTRTFFQEGRWRAIYEDINPNDLVLFQFGHNDNAPNKPERAVNIEGYKEFLRLFVLQARQKGGIPILLTPVNRNYPWEDGVLKNVHGEYPQAVKDIALEMNVLLIDLTTLSCDHFTMIGQEYIKEKYFMNLPAGVYPAYPDGQNDNTHFQPEGAQAVAQLVFDAMKRLSSLRID